MSNGIEPGPLIGVQKGVWDELFPAEQARIVALLAERIDIGRGDSTFAFV